MGPEIVNKNKNCEFHGHYAGRDQYNIILLPDTEREFVVTHRVNIKPVYYFTGRKTELKELSDRIEQGRKSVLVSGMGGIGKTHICRKLFEEYERKNRQREPIPFQHIGYIEYSGDMDSSLLNCLKFKEQINPEQNLEAAWKELEYLSSDGKLLLFVDNVDKPIWEDAGLQRLETIPGAIVITSRMTSFGGAFEPCPIGFLNIEECVRIYETIRFNNSERKVNPEELFDLEYIIEKLAGKHTITVEHLAYLARTKHWKVKRLRKELEEKGFCLEFHKEGELINIQESYEILYDISKLTEAEQNILEAFSVFPYIPLEAETCNEWLFADANVNEDDDILMGLYEKGWLEFNIEQESYGLHPVFAQFIYEKDKPKIERHLGLIEKCQESLEIPQNGSALECQKFIPFAENMVKKIDMGEEIEQVRLIDALAYILKYIAEYSKAKELFEKSLHIREEVLGKNHPTTATSYNNLAGVYKNQGEYLKAEELYKKSLHIREEVLGENHPDTADSYNNLASVYMDQGEYLKAEELYKKSLHIREELLGQNHPDTATSYNNLALVYKNQGEYHKAQALFEKSLHIRKKLLGENHPTTATSYNNLALVYKNQGEYHKAQELFEKSLYIREEVLGENHPTTAIFYNNLAGVYADQGEYLKAQVLYEKSLHITEEVLGQNHPDTATSYNNLASVYVDQGEYLKAQALLEKSLHITEEILGQKHPTTTDFYNNLASVYMYQGEYRKALTYYIKAYKTLEFKLGQNHPNTQIVYENLKIPYFKCYPKGNFEQWLEEEMKK